MIDAPAPQKSNLTMLFKQQQELSKKRETPEVDGYTSDEAISSPAVKNSRALPIPVMATEFNDLLIGSCPASTEYISIGRSIFVEPQRGISEISIGGGPSRTSSSMSSEPFFGVEVEKKKVASLISAEEYLIDNDTVEPTGIPMRAIAMSSSIPVVPASIFREELNSSPKANRKPLSVSIDGHAFKERLSSVDVELPSWCCFNVYWGDEPANEDEEFLVPLDLLIFCLMTNGLYDRFVYQATTYFLALKRGMLLLTLRSTLWI